MCMCVCLCVCIYISHIHNNIHIYIHDKILILDLLKFLSSIMIIFILKMVKNTGTIINEQFIRSLILNVIYKKLPHRKIDINYRIYLFLRKYQLLALKI